MTNKFKFSHWKWKSSLNCTSKIKYGTIAVIFFDMSNKAKKWLQNTWNTVKRSYDLQSRFTCGKDKWNQMEKSGRYIVQKFIFFCYMEGKSVMGLEYECEDFWFEY